MKRCPNDLNDAKIRIDYIENHIKWFLKIIQMQLMSF